MGLEWFDRVTGELQDHLESLCDKYDQLGHMSIDRGARHPRIEFYVETTDDDRDYFCTLSFDPHNDEFYMDTFDIETAQNSKTILADIEDITDAVHESFHDYMNGDDDIIGDYEPADDFAGEEEEYYMAEAEPDGDIINQIDVEWKTPEVTAFMHEDEVEVTYQFGVVEETGDGVLRRVNRIWTEDDDLIKDESNFIFSKEEANTIIALIATHMDSMSEFNFDQQ
ncbi:MULTISPECIES: hypothetical protein [Bacillus]|uniref:hypothetical protein n=1 Tax=Bacillus TaxID=1386 RepID=UPI000C772C4A|nr:MULTISPECIES: hypothetical protein [Bacillus]PLR84304.1 hypothetical protein CVD23_12120 [Bacillus sp. V33-4]RSK52923.1 hypothetical protein EJA13_09680 [Bacillus canaveralius]